jgi:cold shock protein
MILGLSVRRLYIEKFLPFRSRAHSRPAFAFVRRRTGSGGSEFLLKEAPMNIGTVKWFNIQRGYGFIQPEDGSNDVFVHISAVERSDLGNLQEGQKLGYELEKSEQGKISAVSLQTV